MHSISRRRGGAALVLTGALLVAACGNGGGGPASPSPASPPVTLSFSPSPVSPSPSPSPSKPAPTLPSADDGARFAACADGACEVAVKGKRKIKLKRATLTVTKFVSGDAVEFRIDLRGGGQGSGTLKGACGATGYFYSGGVRFVGCDASGKPRRPEPMRGEQALQMLGWDAAGAAVLRFAAR